MSTIKDALRTSQGSGNALPQLNIAKRISLKEIGGEVVFSYYDKEIKENVEYPSPIVGILIGQAMEASSYSDNLGSKGGNYTSSYYFTNNDTIALFAHTPKGYEVVHKGNMEAIEAYIKKESTGNLKKKQVLFILTAEGLIAVSTNLSIAIDQVRTNKEELSEKYLVLTPMLFEYLGKFRQKNPPKYAEISTGKFISELDFDKWGAPKMIAEYKAWKEFKTKGGVEQPETSDQPKVNYSAPANRMQPNKEAENVFQKKNKQHTTENASAPSDDLPF